MDRWYGYDALKNERPMDLAEEIETDSWLYWTKIEQGDYRWIIALNEIQN